MQHHDQWRWRDLETLYLATDDPRAQSGFRGDAARWDAARQPVAAAIDRDGTFLDIGCANGLLMESLVAWAAAEGHAIEPHGLDISEKLADLTRTRLPQWADRVFVGDALAWQPPRRFDYARTELVYVPDDQRRVYVGRLLRDVLEPNGRLIVCSYGSSRRPSPRVEPISDHLRAWGHTVIGEAEGLDPENGVVITRVAWIGAE